jgi:hypothetical protein
MDSFLLECGRIQDDTWLVSEQRHTVQCCVHIVAKTLFAEWTLACRRKSVACLDPVEVGANEIHRNSCCYGPCRLLVVAVASKPSSKVTNIESVVELLD